VDKPFRNLFLVALVVVCIISSMPNLYFCLIISNIFDLTKDIARSSVDRIACVCICVCVSSYISITIVLKHRHQLDQLLLLWCPISSSYILFICMLRMANKLMMMCMTTLGIDSCKSPAELRLEDLRIGRFCGVKELTFWFNVGSLNESAFSPASTLSS